MTRKEMARLLREVIGNHDRLLHTAIEEFDWDLIPTDPFGESLRVLREIADELEKPSKDNRGGSMISSDQKAKAIVDLLRGLSEKDDPYDKNEDLETLLNAAAMTHLDIMGIDIKTVNVSTLVLLAKNAMFSSIGIREKHT